MLKIKKSKSSGIAPLFIIIGIIIVIIIGVVIFKIVKNSSNKQPIPTQIPEPVKGEMPKPTYEVIFENVKFSFAEAEDLGNILKCEEMIIPPAKCLPQNNLVTTDKFIKVKITAQNMGQDNIAKDSWEIEELLDNEGRKFYSSEKTLKWIPDESKCGDLLKPNFEPTACIRIYEVSKHSIGLKAKVYATPLEKPKKKDPIKEYFVDLNIYNEKYCWDDSDCACGINKYTKDCFLGNKFYVDSPDPAVYPAAFIENCNNFCATAKTESTVKCINNECK